MTFGCGGGEAVCLLVWIRVPPSISGWPWTYDVAQAGLSPQALGLAPPWASLTFYTHDFHLITHHHKFLKDTSVSNQAWRLVTSTVHITTDVVPTWARTAEMTSHSNNFYDCQVAGGTVKVLLRTEKHSDWETSKCGGKGYLRIDEIRVTHIIYIAQLWTYSTTMRSESKIFTLT